MAPTLAASYAVYSASADNTTLTKTGITVLTNDVLVAKAATWDTGNGMAAPTTSGQTWHQVNIGAPGGFAGWAGIWVMTVSGSPGTVDVSMAPATGSNTRHSMVVERWTGAQVDASPATNATIHGTGTSGTTTLTTVSANSAVSWVLSEANSLDPATSSYASGATQDGLYDGHSGSNGVQYFATQTAASAGSQTIGITNSSSTNWTMVGAEIRAGSTVVTGTASDSVTISDSPARTAVLPRGPADSLTLADSPARQVLLARGPADSLTISDSPARQVVAGRATADGLGISDSLVSAVVLARTPADAMALADSPTRTVLLARAITDHITFTDAASVAGQIFDITATAGTPGRAWMAGRPH